MSTQYFYSNGDQRCGPVSFGDLRRLATVGTLRRADLVWTEGMADWSRADTVHQLFAGLPPDIQDNGTQPIACTPEAYAVTGGGGEQCMVGAEACSRPSGGGHGIPLWVMLGGIFGLVVFGWIFYSGGAASGVLPSNAGTGTSAEGQRIMNELRSAPMVNPLHSGGGRNPNYAPPGTMFIYDANGNIVGRIQ